MGLSTGSGEGDSPESDVVPCGDVDNRGSRVAPLNDGLTIADELQVVRGNRQSTGDRMSASNEDGALLLFISSGRVPVVFGPESKGFEGDEAAFTPSVDILTLAGGVLNLPVQVANEEPTVLVFRDDPARRGDLGEEDMLNPSSALHLWRRVAPEQRPVGGAGGVAVEVHKDGGGVRNSDGQTAHIQGSRANEHDRIVVARRS